MEKPLTPLLRVVDLRIHHIGPIRIEADAGGCLGICVPSGSGKSLFLRALADMDPHEGAVLLDGMAQDQMTAPQWRRQVALLPAESVWWFDTVGEHFASPEASAWQRMGFTAQIFSSPVSRLSSGERQRLALLRLLENRPSLLLLDEPTSNLDETNSARVEELIQSYRKETGAAVLWVSHQKAQLARVADRILNMSDGRLSAAAVTAR